VIFGKTGGSAVDLSAIAAGCGGFVINGQCGADVSGRSVSSAGDVNGDGLADLIVGAEQSDPAAGSNAGRGYVVFGQTGSSAVDLSAVAAGTGGFVINGQCAADYSGRSVASAGDVNGDGLADLIVGAYGSDPSGQLDAGRSYVVFGQTESSAVDLSAVAAGIGGFVINGQCAGDRSGRSVSPGGDVNGDGLADLIVGAPYSDPLAGPRSRAQLRDLRQHQRRLLGERRRPARRLQLPTRSPAPPPPRRSSPVPATTRSPATAAPTSSMAVPATTPSSSMPATSPRWRAASPAASSRASTAARGSTPSRSPAAASRSTSPRSPTRARAPRAAPRASSRSNASTSAAAATTP
jgi:hypothetical protein